MLCYFPNASRIFKLFNRKDGIMNLINLMKRYPIKVGIHNFRYVFNYSYFSSNSWLVWLMIPIKILFFLSFLIF